MTGIVKILSLLPILYGEYEEVKLITQLNLFFNFDHNIYLLDASADRKRLINDENTPKTLYVFNADDNSTGLEELTEVKSKNTFTIVFPPTAKYNVNLEFLYYLKEVQRLQIDMKIGMFFKHLLSKDDLMNIFKWCKTNLIVNIFAATYVQDEVIQRPSDERVLNIFTFNPFGPFDVINVTGGNESYERLFPSLKSNFQRNRLLLLDTPYRQYSDDHLWLNVMRRMNATWRLVRSNLANTAEYFESGIDIIPQMYVIENVSQLMYPLKVETPVIIVPEALPYPEFAAYLKTVTTDEFFAYSLFTIVAVMLLLCIIRYVERRKILFFESVADVLNLLANDNGCINYQRLSRVEVFLIVPLTFVGFIFVNGILSNLQSYLTQPVIQPQINTPEDLYRSSINIMITDETKKIRLINLLSNLTEHKDWHKKITFMDSAALAMGLQSFNRSISNMCSISDAIALLEVQKRLNIKGYRVPEIQMSHLLLTYCVNDKFLFFERLNEIIHRIQSAGLYEEWLRRDQAHIVNVLLKRTSKHLKSHEGNDVESGGLPLPMFIVYGWLASVIVLFIEIIWKKFNFALMRTEIQEWLTTVSKSQQAKSDKQVKAHHLRKDRSDADDLQTAVVVSVQDFDDSDDGSSNGVDSKLNSNFNSSSNSATDRLNASTANTICSDIPIPPILGLPTPGFENSKTELGSVS